MIKTNFSSGNIKNKSDFYIEYVPSKSGKINLDIKSKTMILHGTKLKKTILNTLNDLEVKSGNFYITDNGGQYFVLKARLESVIKDANPKIKKQSLPKFNEHSQYKSKKDRFRRSRLYLPGSQAKLMLNAGIHNPDGIILALEDSVAPSDKASARLIVRNALRHLNFHGAERMVRINQGELGLKDLEKVIRSLSDKLNTLCPCRINPLLILIPVLY